ncbi:MAG: PPC domain-containing DNA-binding protein [Verrucomicrobiota bacterium]
MKTRLINDDNQRTWIIVFESGEEAVSGITEFATVHELAASQISAIGAFCEVELAYFNIESKQYEKIPVHEQVEVLSLLGDVTLSENQPKVHLHAVLGRRDGSTRGGHLIKGVVRPTLEVVLTESPVHLRRKFDPEVGLALIEPDLR